MPALLGAITAQKPTTYDPMLRELAALYRRGNEAVYAGPPENGNLVGDVDVVSEFGVDFIRKSAQEMLEEVQRRVLASRTPGWYVTAIYFARRLTMIFGCMGLIYCESGASWISSRRTTWELVRASIGISGEDSFSSIVLRILDQYANPGVTP